MNLKKGSQVDLKSLLNSIFSLVTETRIENHQYRKFSNKGAVRPSTTWVRSYLKSRAQELSNSIWQPIFLLDIGTSYTVGKLMHSSFRFWKKGCALIGSAPLLDNLRYIGLLPVKKASPVRTWPIRGRRIVSIDWNCNLILSILPGSLSPEEVEIKCVPSPESNQRNIIIVGISSPRVEKSSTIHIICVHYFFHNLGYILLSNLIKK